MLCVERRAVTVAAETGELARIGNGSPIAYTWYYPNLVTLDHNLQEQRRL